MSYKGKFRPKHPEKYRGDVSKIVWRSTWELSCMKRFDEDSNVLMWSSEEIIVPYYCPVERKNRRYFPDFVIQVKSETGYKILMLEIKPYKQTIEPKAPQRKTKRYLSECLTFANNNAKWDAANKYCENRGWKFQILTENEIGIK